MTDYVTIPNEDIDQDSPVTQPLMTALRDNPVAIAEGNPDAPEVNARAQTYRTVYGTGNTVTFSSLGGFGGMWADIYFENNTAGVANFTVQYSTDGGLNFSSAQNIASAPALATINGRIFINFSDGAYKLITFTEANSGTIMGMAEGVTDIRFDGPGNTSLGILAAPNRGEAS